MYDNICDITTIADRRPIDAREHNHTWEYSARLYKEARRGFEQFIMPQSYLKDRWIDRVTSITVTDNVYTTATIDRRSHRVRSVCCEPDYSSLQCRPGDQVNCKLQTKRMREREMISIRARGRCKRSANKAYMYYEVLYVFFVRSSIKTFVVYTLATCIGWWIISLIRRRLCAINKALEKIQLSKTNTQRVHQQQHIVDTSCEGTEYFIRSSVLKLRPLSTKDLRLATILAKV